MTQVRATIVIQHADGSITWREVDPVESLSVENSVVDVTSADDAWAHFIATDVITVTISGRSGSAADAPPRWITGV